MNAHPHHHDAEDIDWDALGTKLERGAELHIPALEQAAARLRELLRTDDAADADEPRVHRILDVGSGPGVAACLLAHRFPHAEVVAVDQSPGLLERARQRAARQHVSDRVSTQQAELPDEFDTLGPADLIWTSNVVHHLADQRAALAALAARLRPGGVLAVAERGLPVRFLPRDIGTGRPGLQARVDAALEDTFTAMRAQLPGSIATVEDWPALLTGAGLVPTGSSTFLIDHPAPLGLPAREYLHAHLSGLRERIGDRLGPEDRATLESLVDGDTRTGILRRPDAFYLTATTVHTARLRATA